MNSKESIRSIIGNEAFRSLVKTAIVSIGTYYTFKYFLSLLDPTKAKIKPISKSTKDLLNELNVQSLDDYEVALLPYLVHPDDVQTSWDDIAGMEEVREQIFTNVVFPLKAVDLHKKSLIYCPPKGVLLYGPPGCGKTMVAKATAKETGARFINLDVSSLTDKWYGETQKLASAVFTLARKLQPCIIFVDEIDSLLRARESTDHEATAMLKTQFMQKWDGFSSDPTCTVIVLGATNRALDIDRAFRRRMPIQIFIDLPNYRHRLDILKLYLKNEVLSEDTNLNSIAQATEGFSGSDLYELCRAARAVYVQENQAKIYQNTKKNNLSDVSMNIFRPMTHSDFTKALQQIRASNARINSSLELD